MSFVSLIFIFFFFKKRETNCGGNGTTFLFFPSEVVEPCITYQWEVTVFFGGLDGSIASSTIFLCPVELTAAPKGSTQQNSNYDFLILLRFSLFIFIFLYYIL